MDCLAWRIKWSANSLPCSSSPSFQIPLTSISISIRKISLRYRNGCDAAVSSSSSPPASHRLHRCCSYSITTKGDNALECNLRRFRGPAGIIVATRLSENRTKKVASLGGRGNHPTASPEDLRDPFWLEGTNLSRVDVPGLYSSVFSTATNMTCGNDLIKAFGGCTIGGGSPINIATWYNSYQNPSLLLPIFCFIQILSILTRSNSNQRG